MRKISIFILCVLLVIARPLSAEHCSRQQAFDKHTLLSMESLKNEDLQMRIDIASLGKVLASGNYDLACLEYDRVAAKYGIQFNQAAKNLKAQKDALGAASRITKRCSSTESAAYFQKVHKKMKESNDKEAEEKLGQWYDMHSSEMIVNPDVFCSNLQQFLKSSEQ